MAWVHDLLLSCGKHELGTGSGGAVESHATVSTRAAAAERAILPSPVGSKFPLRLRTEPARARGRALRSGFPCYSASGWRFGAASRKAVSKAQFSSMAS